MKQNSTSKAKAHHKTQHPFVQGELFPNLAKNEASQHENTIEKVTAFDFWKPEVFPIHEANEQTVSPPIESRVYNNIQVNNYRTKEGMNILSVMGSDGVMMSVPGSFDSPIEMTQTVVEEKRPLPHSAGLKAKKDSLSATHLASKADAFKSQIKEAPTPQPDKPKAPYNLADVPPLTYGTPRKEGVNLLRIFRPGCK